MKESNANVICSPGFVIGRLVASESYIDVEKEIMSQKSIIEPDMAETIKKGRRMFKAREKEIKIQDHPYLFLVDFTFQDADGNTPIDFQVGDVLAVSHRWAGRIQADLNGEESNSSMGTQFDIFFYEGVEYVKLPLDVFVANVKTYRDRIIEKDGKLLLKK